MPKVKKQSVRDVQRKAQSARDYARYGQAENEVSDAAMNLSRGPKKGIEKVIGRSTTKAESKAAKLMQTQRAAETTRSAVRAAAVTKRAKAVAEKAKTTRALTGVTKKAKKK